MYKPFWLAVSSAVLMAAPLAAHSESAFQATKSLRIVAPSSPGGILDQTSRLVAKALGEVCTKRSSLKTTPAPAAPWAFRPCCAPNPTATPW